MSINIQYISDIHLEFYNYNKVVKLVNKIEPIAPILVLAGDIGIPISRNKKCKYKINRCYEYFLELIAKKFEKIFIIAGNHEYYNRFNVSISEVNKIISGICNKILNIVFLNNNYYDYNGFRFIGSTLWSEIDEKPQIILNDMTRIPNMTPEYYNELHYKSLELLDIILKESMKISIPCIIITHHLHMIELINIPNRKNDDEIMYEWFASDLTELIDDYNNIICVWIYGHTHYKSYKIHKNIKFVANPIGYPHEMTHQKYVKTVIITHDNPGNSH